ncbi:tRNA threonylcarbamoyladenosine dehydratase [uncultured Bdellovibrio sp.]|uniref:tRNA threonylcarbamoyladenosine dehydratase n=1 Tax=Bdellovibrio sp. HCB-162 TaxID=3394234 RepID=UPI0025D2BC50|nr:tRNA threonylcarbamoyladenosine dehydratase [uncultured Bdellovibrio sp.]
MEMNPENNLPQPPETEYVLHRRFDRMGRLVGDPTMKKLFNTHVMVIGLGGVGSWAAESLARSGVGKITVIDFDEICITNANRQIHALQGLVGKKKAEIMGERLRKINPQSTVNVIPEFYNEENSAMMLSHNPDYIVDAIDNLTAKAHLLATCREKGIKVITTGGSAAKMDPLRIKMADLGETYGDPMAASVRKILRQKHNFPESKKFGIPCVFSDEIPKLPEELKYDNGQGFKCVCPTKSSLHGCDNRNVIHGTASFVTGAFGLAMASYVVNQIHAEVKSAMAPKETSGEA